MGEEAEELVPEDDEDGESGSVMKGRYMPRMETAVAKAGRESFR